MHQDHIPRAKTIALILLAAIVSAAPAAAQPAPPSTADATLMPAVWQGPEIGAPAMTAKLDAESTQSALNPLRVALQPAPPIPPQNFHVAPQSGVNSATQPQPPAATDSSSLGDERGINR